MSNARTKKNLYITLGVVTLLLIAIGYAIINSNLRINGNTKLKKNTWDVRFENLEESSDSVKSIISEIDNSTTINTSVILQKPGDFYEYSVDIVNAGSIDAMIESVNATGLSSEQEKYIDYSYSYSDGSPINTKQLLKAGIFKTIKVRIIYKKDVNSSDLPNVDQNINLELSINYVQADDR